MSRTAWMTAVVGLSILGMSVCVNIVGVRRMSQAAEHSVVSSRTTAPHAPTSAPAPQAVLPVAAGRTVQPQEAEAEGLRGIHALEPESAAGADHDGGKVTLLPYVCDVETQLWTQIEKRSPGLQKLNDHERALLVWETTADFLGVGGAAFATLARMAIDDIEQAYEIFDRDRNRIRARYASDDDEGAKAEWGPVLRQWDEAVALARSRFGGLLAPETNARHRWFLDQLEGWHWRTVYPR